jgi:hypothetical protein
LSNHILHTIALRRKIAALLLLLLFTGAFLPTQAQQAPGREYQVKAVFLYNFTQFVEWPPAAFNGNEPMVIGVLGENPFGNYLEETVSGEKVTGRKLVVRYYKEVKDIGNCHILFIGGSTKAKEAMAAVSGKHTLTVSDADEFARSGGMIQLYIEHNKVRFKINNTVAKGAGLTISSKLLRLADVVE